ncbi:MAG: stage III sporulation protein AA [Clostridia bacterium]|nr:stage III sporulation protein AA [Clostridia bacterium]
MRASLARLLACLPKHLYREITRMQETNADFWQRLEEIRLRAGHHAALTFDGRNCPLPIVLTKEEVAAAFADMCDRSVYAHAESLRAGYVSAFGFRVGVAGRIVVEGGRILTVTDVTSLSVRVPHHVPGAGEAAVRTFWDRHGKRGLLVYSPPGVGKTTLLRDVAYTLSRGERALRVALIDTRGELYGEEVPVACQLDVLRDCPIAEGIMIATRTLSPQLIICDEIGSEAEANAVLSTVGCGVPILASAHGGSVDEIRSRPPLRRLLDARVFGAAVGIRREAVGYAYTVSDLEEGAACYV